MQKTDARSVPSPDPRPPRLAAFLSIGLRPFFLGAALFAFVAIGLWILNLHGLTLIAPGQGMRGWHMHEMLFGYGAAVLAGFLLTAVPNWTGGKAMSGPGLGLLWLLWLAGRVAMLSGGTWGLAAGLAAIVDMVFLPVLALIVARAIVGARNWRNLIVLGPILMMIGGNVTFHVETWLYDGAEYGARAGLGGLVFLIMLIGGRIVPAFTRNWLVKRGVTRLPVGFSRLDGGILVISLVGLLVWVVVPEGTVTALLLGLMAVLHGLRLTRWCGLATRSDPLLLVLHVSYAVIPAGLALLAIGAALQDPPVQLAALHLLGIGAVGGMTLSVMTRASLGHTGRALRADGWMQSAFAAIFLSALFRVAAEFSTAQSAMITISALFWLAGFALFVARIGPGLVTPRPGA